MPCTPKYWNGAAPYYPSISPRSTATSRPLAPCLPIAFGWRGSSVLAKTAPDSWNGSSDWAVDYVVAIPAVSEEGRVARRDLIRKLGELEDYLATLFSAAWARKELGAGPDRGLDRVRQDASRFDDRRISDTDRAFVFSFK